MNRLLSRARSLMLGLALAGAALMAAAPAWADQIILKDGTVIDGTIQREEADFVIVVVKVNGRDEVKVIERSKIERLVKDAEAPAPAPKADPKPEAPAPAPTAPKSDPASPASPAPAPAPAAPGTAGDPAKPATPAGDGKTQARKSAPLSSTARIAILDFGQPAGTKDRVEDTVGGEINPQAWHAVVPMLKKDNVNTVVVRVNSGGGFVSAVFEFHKVFEQEYIPNFRTVAWFESGISAAIMSPWVIPEFYVLPHGNFGGAVAHMGGVAAVEGFSLEDILQKMESASKRASRDFRIVKSMMLLEPLSANIDDSGNVTFFQDLSGAYVVNPLGRVLTLTASEAVRFGVAKGIAATPDELAKLMGYTEWEFGGQQASRYIDNNMREMARASKSFEAVYTKYQISLQGAAQLQDPKLRAGEVGKARQQLRELERWFKLNPMVILQYGIEPTWFREQERILKELLQ